MPDVLGVAAFGLGDACSGKKSVRNPAFLPSSVILPRSWRGAFLAGETAAASRLETGLLWPPEAGVSENTALRRVPVALLWSRLVMDGDRTSYWSPGAGAARSSTASALHAHVSDLLERAGWKEQNLVLAIPDTLDEMGQEDLLRAFGSARERVQLVWRPVAAAMQWLHALGPDFRIGPNDWMLVAYLGPDLLEVTSFSLMHDEETGYPVPVRSRGRKGAALTGMDWAWSCCQGDTVGEKWQQMMRFPEVWESLTRRGGTSGGLELWSRADGSWDLWNPEKNLFPWQNARARECPWISAQIGRKSVRECSSWEALLYAAVQGEVEKRGRAGRIRGVVLCGPLMPRERPRWLDGRTCAGMLSLSRTPMPDTIWLPLRTDADIVAEGARLYGERLRDDLPTYLDTLPGLRIMTEDRRRHRIWQSLVDAATCKGGKEYTNEVEGFSYQKRHSSLTAYLKKDTEEAYRCEEVPFPFVPVKDIPIVMRVRMKPASGLAQVRLVALDNSVEELLFDFSRMQEIDTLPKEELFCPDDGHITLSTAMTTYEKASFRTDCLYFVKSAPTVESLTKYAGMRTKWLMPSRPLKLIDENGNTVQGLEKEFMQVAGQLVNIRNNAGQLFPQLARQASFLWGRTPAAFRKEIAGGIRRALKGEKLHRYFIETAGRCFGTKEDCRLLFQYVVREGRQYSFALTAAFHVLHYRPEACNALNDDLACSLLETALDMMEAQREDKKVKFMNAASLIFVLLKYRLQSGHMNFMGEDDARTAKFHVREKLQRYIAEIEQELGDAGHRFRLAARTKNNLAKSRQYLEDILKYIDYKGDPSAVPIVSEDDDG